MRLAAVLVSSLVWTTMVLVDGLGFSGCNNGPVDEVDEDEDAWILTFRYVGTSVLLQSTHKLIGGGLATIEGAVIVAREGRR